MSPPSSQHREYLPKDRKSDTRIRLNTTKALTATVRAEVDVATRNGMARTTNRDAEVGKRGTAREDPATSRSAVCRTTDGLVVFANGGRRKVEKGGARVSDGSADCSRCGGGADAVAAGAKFPVCLLRDGSVGDGAGVFGRVDEPEIIGTDLS